MGEGAIKNYKLNFCSIYFSEDTFDYDIALIKIKPKDGSGIKYSDHVQPACLPNPATLYETGKKCHVSGWGKTERGKYIHRFK